MFSLVLGVIDGLKTSSKLTKTAKFYNKSLNFYLKFKNILIISLLLFALIFPLPIPQGIPLLIIAPFFYYYFHDGSYFETRGQNEVPTWNWRTTTSSIYVGRFSLSYATRFRMLLLGSALAFGTSMFLG